MRQLSTGTSLWPLSLKVPKTLHFILRGPGKLPSNQIWAREFLGSLPETSFAGCFISAGAVNVWNDYETSLSEQTRP